MNIEGASEQPGETRSSDYLKQSLFIVGYIRDYVSNAG